MFRLSTLVFSLFYIFIFAEKQMGKLTYMMGKLTKRFYRVAVFCIAMGFLEAAVVVYVRQIYYPAGFAFPLNPYISPLLLNVEWLREFSIIVMLVCIGIISGKSFPEKVAYFIYSFAIWDIFYYIWLKAILNWPPSILTWDLLFLIPVPWIAPVLAPLICSLTMVILSVGAIYFVEKGYIAKGNFCEWALVLSGAFLIFISFIWDYSKIIVTGGFLKNFADLATHREFQQVILSYIPKDYNWYLLIAGEILVFFGFFLFCKRNQKSFCN